MTDANMRLTVDGYVPRRVVDASDGAKIIWRQQLNDPTFYAQVKNAIFVDGAIQVIDPANTMLKRGDDMIPADSPEGGQLLETLQLQWAEELQGKPGPTIGELLSNSTFPTQPPSYNPQISK